MKKRGRKKIISSLGKKKTVSFSAYPLEEQQLKALYLELKQQRHKYCVKCEDED